MDITIRKVQAHQHIAECVQFNNQTLPIILEWFLASKNDELRIYRDPQGFNTIYLSQSINGVTTIEKATESDYVIFSNGLLRIIGIPFFDLVYQWVEE